MRTSAVLTSLLLAACGSTPTPAPVPPPAPPTVPATVPATVAPTAPATEAVSLADQATAVVLALRSGDASPVQALLKNPVAVAFEHSMDEGPERGSTRVLPDLAAFSGWLVEQRACFAVATDEDEERTGCDAANGLEISGPPACTELCCTFYPAGSDSLVLSHNTLFLDTVCFTADGGLASIRIMDGD